jgi:hypothetical protein
LILDVGLYDGTDTANLFSQKIAEGALTILNVGIVESGSTLLVASLSRPLGYPWFSPPCFELAS